MDDPIRIVVDSAEQRGGVYRLLADLPDLAVEVTRLPVGDYLLGGDLAVERKTTDDFASSIMDRRLFAQVAALKDAYARPVVLIEGAFPPARSKMHPNALRGALSYLVAIEGVTVLRTEDAEDSALLLVQLARHAQRGLKTPPALVPKPSAARLAEQQERIVAALPEIGQSLARLLLTHFGSPGATLAAPAVELQRVPGIGPARAATIRRVLETAYTAESAAVTADDGTIRTGRLVPSAPDDARRRGAKTTTRQTGRT